MYISLHCVACFYFISVNTAQLMETPAALQISDIADRQALLVPRTNSICSAFSVNFTNNPVQPPESSRTETISQDPLSELYPLLGTIRALFPP